jgi:hypothetical protein
MTDEQITKELWNAVYLCSTYCCRHGFPASFRVDDIHVFEAGYTVVRFSACMDTEAHSMGELLWRCNKRSLFHLYEEHFDHSILVNSRSSHIYPIGRV